MSVFSDQDILRSLFIKDLEIDPFVRERLNPASYDMSLSLEGMSEFNPFSFNKPIDPFDANTYDYVGLVPKDDKILIHPGHFMLGSVVEYINLKGNICATLEGKSSLARLGLAIHVTAGYVDPGFFGHLVLEIVNFSPRPIYLHKGMKIAQLVLYPTGEVLEPYDKKAGSKYSGQKPGQVSKYFLNI
jgi:dCTP deaminase